MATEEKVKSYLDTSDTADADYRRCSIEIFLDSPAIPPARSKFDIHKDVPANRILSNGYVEEYINGELDDYISMLQGHLVVRITGEDGKVLVNTYYPYGPEHFVDYCKDCHHAEKLPDGRLCHLPALGGAPTPIRKGEYELIQACAMFRPKEGA